MDAGNLIFSDNVAFVFKEWLQGKGIEDPVIICDENTHKYCLPKLQISCEKVIVIPPGENFKNFETLEYILEHLLQLDVKRGDVIVNLGGGVVSDIGGFAASVYRRGIPYVNVPTTLLAMADAAIGGKTGIDFKHLKNYIGTFKLPLEVFISAEFLDTLPEDQIKAAMAEIVKIAVICDRELYDMLEKGGSIEQLVHGSAHRKAVLVNQDFEDKGVRQLLNFGHTFGHAYESLMLEKDSPVLHGFAVAKGMLEELKISGKLGYLNEDIVESVSKLICEKVGVKPMSADERMAIKKYLSADKKNSGTKIVFSLPTSIGEGKIGVELTLDELEVIN